MNKEQLKQIIKEELRKYYVNEGIPLNLAAQRQKTAGNQEQQGNPDEKFFNILATTLNSPKYKKVKIGGQKVQATINFFGESRVVMVNGKPLRGVLIFASNSKERTGQAPATQAVSNATTFFLCKDDNNINLLLPTGTYGDFSILQLGQDSQENPMIKNNLFGYAMEQVQKFLSAKVEKTQFTASKGKIAQGTVAKIPIDSLRAKKVQIQAPQAEFYEPGAKAK